MAVRRTILAATLLLTTMAHPAAPDTMPPNTIPLSQMMRELSARPGFTEALLNELQSGQKTGAALLTPDLVRHLRELILGKDWQGLDHFPGWTMAAINPTVRVVGHVAGKDEKVTSLATAGGKPGGIAPPLTAAFLDLGAFSESSVTSVDLNQPATGPGFDEQALVSTIAPGVTRGDGPNPELAPLHAQSQRLADVLNRLSLTHEVAGLPFTATLSGRGAATPEALVSILQSTGHTVTVTDTRYFANFGHLHYNGQDVLMPFYVNTEILIPNSRQPLLVPVSHAEYEWHITGPLVNAAVSFYFGIDGKAEFRTMDQLDQAWVMKRNAHTYTGADAVEVTRLSAAIVRTYMHLHAAHPALPFGGYYALGVCQDVVAAIELKLTGAATLFPNTADDSFFTNPEDAEINTLIHRLPKDRAGHPPDVSRIFGSLPVGTSNAELATITVPGLGAQLIAVHDAWTDGTLQRTRPRWHRWALLGSGAILLAGVLIWLRRPARHVQPPPPPQPS